MPTVNKKAAGPLTAAALCVFYKKAGAFLLTRSAPVPAPHFFPALFL